MASFNKVILMGNLTRDPDLKTTPSGLSICKLGLAINRVFNKQDGTRGEETTFVDVDAFGKSAETLAKYMSKGKPLMLEGRLKFDSWESPQGDKRSKLGVVLENFQFIGGTSSGEVSNSGSSHYESVSPPARQKESTINPISDIDDDVPF